MKKRVMNKLIDLKMALTYVVAGFVFLQISAAYAACDTTLFLTAPTNLETTFIRKGNGQFNAARSSGNKHKGSDIIVRASYDDKSAYAVHAIASGKVAYAKLNGSITSGHGYIVYIDHENGCYSGYAHLTPNPFTPIQSSDDLLVKVGQFVHAGAIIGYFVNTDADIDSTGNARSTHPEARHQTHFELVEAEKGRSGNGRIIDSILKSPANHINPEPFLTKVGLKIEKGSG